MSRSVTAEAEVVGDGVGEACRSPVGRHGGACKGGGRRVASR